MNQTLERIKIAGIVKTDMVQNQASNIPRTLEKLMIRNRDSMSLMNMSDIILIQREDIEVL